MKLSDVVAGLKAKGYSEEKCLDLAKKQLEAAGAPWTPNRMQLFNEIWRVLSEMDTPEPVVESEKKPTALEKLKQKKKQKVQVEDAPVVVAPKTMPKAKTGSPTVLPAGNAGGFTALLSFFLCTIAWMNGKKMAEVRPMLEKNGPILETFLKQIKMNTTDYKIISDLILGSKVYSEDKRGKNVVGLGQALKQVFDVFSGRDYHFATPKLTLLKQLGAYLRSSQRSDNQFKNIVNGAGVVGLPEIARLFGSDVAARLPKVDKGGLESLQKKWWELNKKMGGNEYGIIPIAKKPAKKYDKKGKEIPYEAPAKTPLELEYKEVAKQLRERYNNIVQEIVMNQGERLPGSDHTTMDVKDIRPQLEQLGLTWSRIPKGFVGRINSKAELCTSQGWKINTPGGGIVKMTPNLYNPENGKGTYCQGLKPSGKKDPAFSEKHTQAGGHRDSSKIGAVDEFLANETAFRAKWFNVVKHGAKDPSVPNYTKAVMLEGMYQLAPRPGSKEEGGNNTKFEAPTKGFTYLQKKDIVIHNDKIVFDFFDKNGRQILTLPKAGRPAPDEQSATDALILFNAIKYFHGKTKSEDDFVWSDTKGENVKYSDLSAYLHTIVPKPFGLHKFRHVKATKIAQSVLDSCNLKVGKATSKEVSEYFLKAMEDVGAQLGHRSKEKVSGGQALRSYVSKTVSRQFFSRYQVKEAPGIAKVINIEESSTSEPKTYNIVVRKNRI
jgi:hypothetical protein